MKLVFEDIQDLQIKDLANTFEASPQKALEEVTLYDLILDGSAKLPHLHGVYFFYDSTGGTLLYVGRVKSPQFIERLPSHLALGEGSWSNQFLRTHREKTNAKTLEDAADSARGCQILLLLSPLQCAAKLEALCIRKLNPRYNKTKPKSGLPSVIEDSMRIRDLFVPQK